MRKTKEQISYNMSRIKNSDSAIEIALRKKLWSRGLRYRKNVSQIYGHPDIVFIKKKIAVFVDGDFWHGYDWDKRKYDFKSNQNFWVPKIERNIQRDIEVTSRLSSEGWTVIRIWGNEIKKNVDSCADRIEKAYKEMQ